MLGSHPDHNETNVIAQHDKSYLHLASEDDNEVDGDNHSATNE